MAIKTLVTTRQIELINKREFTNIALDENSETFVVYITTINTILIYLSQIFLVQELDKSILATL